MRTCQVFAQTHILVRAKVYNYLGKWVFKRLTVHAQDKAQFQNYYKQYYISTYIVRSLFSHKI